MKGPDGKEELKESQKALDILGGEVMDAKIFTLPNSDIERYVILIKNVDTHQQIIPERAASRQNSLSNDDESRII